MGKLFILLVTTRTWTQIVYWQRFWGSNQRITTAIISSQIRIRVEVAFGLLVNKWRRLQSPLRFSLASVGPFLNSIFILYNFCINRRLENEIINGVDLQLLTTYGVRPEKNICSAHLPANIVSTSIRWALSAPTSFWRRCNAALC